MRPGEWRFEVLTRYGHSCPAPEPHTGPLEAHHLIYRSRGGVEDPENGISLCRGHHGAVHARTLLIARSWLHDDSLEYLSAAGYVDWDEDGEPFGTGHKGFAPLPPHSQTAMVSLTWHPPPRRS